MALFPDLLCARMRNLIPARTSCFAAGSLCAVCGQWQDDAICRTCRDRFVGAYPRCAACAIRLPKLTEGHTHWQAGQCCGACLRESPPFAHAVAAVDYAYPWGHVILTMKHHPAAMGAEPLSRLLAQAVSDTYARPLPTSARSDSPVDLIIPVPMAIDRLKYRGHNQAWEIARRLSSHLTIPARADLIHRWPGAAPQQSLDRAARRHNMRGAFHLSSSAREQCLDGLRVALVDDVMTTGATLQSLAHTALAAGAVEVHAWTVARTPA